MIVLYKLVPPTTEISVIQFKVHLLLDITIAVEVQQQDKKRDKSEIQREIELNRKEV